METRTCPSVVLALLLVGAGIWPLYATEYFVDRNHAKASDKNPGSREQPFKTINGSLSKLKAGDTVWVRKGVYRESVLLSSKPFAPHKMSYAMMPSGKSYAQMVNFCAWPGEDVTIKGSDLVTGWKKHKDNIWVREDWPHNSQQVFADGKILQQIGGVVSKHLSQRRRWRGRKGDGLEDMEAGSFYYDMERKKLYVRLADGADPNGRQLEASVRPYLWHIRRLDYFRVVGFKIRHSNSSAYTGWAAVSLSGSHNIMENVSVEWADFGGLGVGGSNNAIVNCRMNHSGCVGLGASGWGHRFINCETSYNNYRYWYAGWHAGGVKIIPRAHDIVMSGHVAAHNYKSPGIWFDGSNSNVTIQNCISHHNGGPGIMYEISERATIKNNLCYENEGRGIYVSSSSYCAILHNTCYRNGMSGIVVIGYKRTGGMMGRGKENCWPGGHNVIWGNILMDNCHPDLCRKGWENRPELILPPDTDYNEGNVSDYNLFYRSDGRPMPFWKHWDSPVGKDLAEWRKNSGHDVNSIVAKPLFRNLEERDLRPADGSPALWMVKPSQSVVFDLDFQPRSFKDAYLTAGAYEADVKLLKEYLAGTKPARAGKYTLVPLDEKRLESVLLGDKSLDPIVYGLRAIKHKPLSSGVMGIELKGVPFAQKDYRRLLRLTKEKSAVTVPVGKKAKVLHLLLAAVRPGTAPLATCVIHREDGHKITLAWEGGKNIGPSMGKWKGVIVNDPKAPVKTDIIWRGKWLNTPVRFFRTAWDNENEWYPIKQIELTLVNPDAQLLLLGVTVE